MFAPRRGRLGIGLLVFLHSSIAFAQPCGPTWAEGLFQPQGTNEYVRALTVFDPPGPDGPALYAGAAFATARG